MNSGRLIVLSGPSGVGKTTICKYIVSRREDILYSISATSRPKRKGEQHGREYFFLTDSEFRQWIENGRFVEYAEVHGNLYGTPKHFIEETLHKGLHVIMDIDVIGAKKLMTLYPYPAGIYFFIIPPDIMELERRLLQRNTDPNQEIKNRLGSALKELQYQDDYQYKIINQDLEKTIAEVIATIEKEIHG